MITLPKSIDDTLALLARADYVAERSLATAVFLALKLKLPLFLEGEAGVGKTSLVRRFCSEGEEARRVLTGSCDPLFTPRPLGPLLAIAEQASGELEEAVSRGLTPYEVVAALARDWDGRLVALQHNLDQRADPST